ncbi:nucleolar pre-ribosomal-associated protein 1 [Oratosquilla oratoria]|uniref:nucleolar pre-ribosomal-associated protein 1 n=1 Tax=Oratosquilla oratoria TaxID=337810 RepID=UPI003F75724C
MNGTVFIKELQGNLPIPALEKFNRTADDASDDQDLVHDYLLASSNCDEILDLLQTETRSGGELGTIFTSIGHVLLRIARDLPQFTGVALHVTRHILHNHVVQLGRILSPTNTNKNVIAGLRCVTSMVMVSPATATEVMNSLDWSRFHLPVNANRRDPKNPRDVRAWCIYMLLAFLNVDDINVIKQFLSGKDVLTSIFPGLIHDPCERVLNVLRVLLDSIVLSPEVSKTIKVQIFNAYSVKPLLQLYRWKGPKGRKKLNENEDYMDDDSFDTERESIVATLHKLMMILCTSYKHGVIFRERTSDGGKKTSNNHVLKILNNIQSPWEMKESLELVSTCLGCCSDIVKVYLSNLKDYFIPRPTPSFIRLLDMLKKIIGNMEPWRQISGTGFYNLASFLIPAPLTQDLFKKMLGSPYESVRHAAVELVHSIFVKTKESLNEIKKMSLSADEKKDICKRNTEIICKVTGGLANIWKCWRFATGQEILEVDEKEHENFVSETVDPVPVFTALLAIARIITLYGELRPHDDIENVIDIPEIMQVIQKLKSENDSESTIEFLELQTLPLSLLTKSEKRIKASVVTVDGEQGEEQVEQSIYYLIICVYVSCNALTSQEMEDTQKNVLYSTMDKCVNLLAQVLPRSGMSLEYEGNFKMWLKNIKKEKSDKHAKFFTQIIHKTLSSLTVYSDLLVEISNKYFSLNFKEDNEMAQLLENIDEIEIEDNTDISGLKITLPFSRLIPAAVELLESNTDEENIDYFSKVMFDYIHSLKDPKLLAHYLFSKEKILSKCMQNYMTNLLQPRKKYQEEEFVIEEDDDFNVKLQKIFVAKKEEKLKDLVDGVGIDSLGEKEDLVHIVMQLLLYISISEKEDNKYSSGNDYYVYVIKYIYTMLDLEARHKTIAGEVLCTILNHSLMIDHYQPFTCESSSVNDLVKEVLSLASVNCKKYPESVVFTKPYYKKLVHQLHSVLLQESLPEDFLSPLAPFISSGCLNISYNSVEDLVNICFKHAAPSENLITLELRLIQILQKTLSAKRRPKTSTIEIILSRMIQIGRCRNKSEQEVEMYKTMEVILVSAVTPKIAEQVVLDKVKQLLRCSPPSSDFCLRLLQICPGYLPSFFKYFKKHSPKLPRELPVLLEMIRLEEKLEEEKKVTEKAVMNGEAEKNLEKEASEECYSGLAKPMKKERKCQEGKEVCNGDVVDHLIPMELDEKCVEGTNVHEKGSSDLREKAAHMKGGEAENVKTCIGEKRDCVTSVKIFEILGKCKDNVLAWITMEECDGSPEYPQLLKLLLHYDVFSKEEIASACLLIYEKVMTKKLIPKTHFYHASVLFGKMEENIPGSKDLPHGDARLSLLLVCLTVLKMCYGKVTEAGTDTNFVDGIAEVIPNLLKSLKASDVQQSLQDKKLWASYVKQVLRTALQDVNQGPKLLQGLSELCSVIYQRNHTLLPISTLYQMILSHSNYLDLMFEKDPKSEPLKGGVVDLQQTLVDCEASVCQEKHVPILLGAYGGTMSTVDQRILKLLHTYETKGSMLTYQPVLWGETAIHHYGILAGSSGFSFYREPKPDQILMLLDKDKILHTCFNFDVEISPVPSEVKGNNPEIYDVRYLLPLALYLAKQGTDGMLLAESGAFALGLAALSSRQQDMWSLGAGLLKTLVGMMENSSYRRLKLQWIWTVNVIRHALRAEYRRLPSITTHFLIHCVHLIPQPSHVMYSTVLNYLYLRPAFKIFQVPELYRLFSPENIENHKDQRLFLLNFLTTGIRDSLDYKITCKRYTSKLIMLLAASPTANVHIKVHCLAVLEAMCKVLLGAAELVRKHSLLTFLPQLISTVQASPSSQSLSLLIEAIVKVLQALWTTFVTSVERVKVVDKAETEDSVNEGRSAKRKRTHSGKPLKKPKLTNGMHNDKDTSESDSESNDSNDSSSDSGDDEQSESELEEKSVTSSPEVTGVKVLPLVMVKDFISCLLYILPKAFANSPLPTIAEVLNLVADSLQYMKKAFNLCVKSRIREVAFDPDVLKQQIEAFIDWQYLMENLKDHITEQDEICILGQKKKYFEESWQNEPLANYLQESSVQPSQSEDKDNSEEGTQKLVLAVRRLCVVLDRQ